MMRTRTSTIVSSCSLNGRDPIWIPGQLGPSHGLRHRAVVRVDALKCVWVLGRGAIGAGTKIKVLFARLRNRPPAVRG